MIGWPGHATNKDSRYSGLLIWRVYYPLGEYVVNHSKGAKGQQRPMIANTFFGFLACLLLMNVVLLVLVVLAGLWEKRPVWPYVRVDEPAGAMVTPRRDDTNPYAPGHIGKSDALLTDYVAGRNRVAEALGFEPLGVFRDGKGRIYRIRYDFWRSQVGDVLAIIGGGTLAFIPVHNTWLFTRLTDGRCLLTLDTKLASESDPTGLTNAAVISRADLHDLLDYHRRRLAAEPVPILPYSKADPLRDHREFLTRRSQRLVELGHARFLDPARTTWRPTFRGALVSAVREYLTGMRRIAWPDRWLGILRKRAEASKIESFADRGRQEREAEADQPDFERQERS